MQTIRALLPLSFLLLASQLQFAQAQQATPEQRSAIVEVFAEARGFAAGLAAAHAPKAPKSQANGDARTVSTGGVTVTYKPVQDSSSILPYSVEAVGVHAVQRVSKWLGETHQPSIAQTLGKSVELSTTRMKFLGPAEICEEESLVLVFSGKNVVKATWVFCAD